MSFDLIRGQGGQPLVKGRCDHCPRTEVVRAMHGKNGRDGHGQAVTKLQKLGWTFIGKVLRCPACEAKRKVSKMVVKKQSVAAPIRVPTRKDKREIIDLLRDVYDTGAGCYLRGDTDETVADVLGVMPGWVAEVREAFFGGDGGNRDMEALSLKIDVFLKETGLRIDRLSAEQSDLQSMQDRAKAYVAELDKIRRAVGPRVMKAAK